MARENHGSEFSNLFFNKPEYAAYKAPRIRPMSQPLPTKRLRVRRVAYPSLLQSFATGNC